MRRAFRQLIRYDAPQLMIVERFGYIAIATGFAYMLLVSFHRPRGKRNDRNGASRRIGFEQRGSLQPAHARQIDIHQDQIGPFRMSQRQPRICIVSLQYGLPRHFQHESGQP